MENYEEGYRQGYNQGFIDGNWKWRGRSVTNGDRIRQMSNEELVEVISMSIGGCPFCIYNDISYCKKGMCKEGIKAYLESEEE